MYKNQLQELAQRSCFNLPSYTCIRQGPDHAPRFKAAVNFNGDVFESPTFCSTLRQAEHAAAEVALNSLSQRGPSHSLAARILDETGVYKNLLQEVAQRVGASLPSYTTFRSGLGHLPVFTCSVELAGIIFTGEPAKNKKQAEKNAAMSAWSSLKQLAQESANSSKEPINSDEQEQVTVARALLKYIVKEKMAMANNPYATPFPKKFVLQGDKKPAEVQPSSPSVSRILPLIRPKSSQRARPVSPASSEGNLLPPYLQMQPENYANRKHNFSVAGAAPYIPVRHFNSPCHRMAAPVTIRTSVPVFSAPPLPRPAAQVQQVPSAITHQPIRMASPVRIRPVVPVFATPPPLPATVPLFPDSPKEPSQVVAPRAEPLPVVAQVVPAAAKEALPSIQLKPSVCSSVSTLMQPSSELPKILEVDVAKDLEQSESAVIETLKQLEL